MKLAAGSGVAQYRVETAPGFLEVMQNPDAVHQVETAGGVFDQVSLHDLDEVVRGGVAARGVDRRTEVDADQSGRSPGASVQQQAGVATAEFEYLSVLEIGGGQRRHVVFELGARVDGAGWQIVPGTGKGLGGCLVGTAAHASAPVGVSFKLSSTS